MDNKSNITKLFLKEKTYLVPREPKEGQEQISLSFRPIPVTNTEIYSKFSLMTENTSMDKMLELIIPIVAYSLDLSSEEVTKLDIGMIMELFEIISEVNNFAGSKKESKPDIQKFIKDKQELAKNKELTKSITAA